MTSRILDALTRDPWGCDSDTLETVAAVVQREHTESVEAVQARLGRPLMNTRSVTVREGVAVIPVTGVIARRANLFTEISGGTSLEVLITDIAKAEDDPQVRAIVFDLDSPGGSVNGVSEAAAFIRDAVQKPTIAHISNQASSAAYWLAAAADEIVIGDTAVAGSIGVVSVVRRVPADDAVEIVSTQSPRKRIDIDTEDGRAAIQARVDELADVFVTTVARYREMDKEQLIAAGDSGGVRVGAAAVASGLADRLGTLESTIDEARRKSRMTVENTLAALDLPQLKESRPDLVESVITESREEIAAEAAQAERARIKEILACAPREFEAMAREIAFDTDMSTGAAAIELMKAQKAAEDTRAEAVAKDRPAPVAAEASATGEDSGASLTDDERDAKAWDSDEALRAEFGNNREAFLAFQKAERAGRVRVFRSA